MSAAAARAGSRLVRVVVREIQLRAAGRGQPITLSAEDLDAIAEQVEEEVVDLRRRVGLVDARALAAELCVARDWVYANADRLGGVRLGDGPRARLRFNVEWAREALSEPALAGKASAARKPHAGRSGRPRRQALAGVKLIQG